MGTLKCDLCSYVCNKLWHLKSHRKTHKTGEPLLVCNSCCYQASNVRQLTRHQNAVHVESPDRSRSEVLSTLHGATCDREESLLPESVISFDPASGMVLTKIRLTKTKFNQVRFEKCVPRGPSAKMSSPYFPDGLMGYGNLNFERPANKLDRGMMTKESSMPLKKRTIISKLMFPCPVCPHMASNSHELEDHLTGHSSDEIVYPCDQCDFMTADTDEMLQHQQNIHGGDVSLLSLPKSPPPTPAATTVSAHVSVIQPNANYEGKAMLSEVSSKVVATEPTTETIYEGDYPMVFVKQTEHNDGKESLELGGFYTDKLRRTRKENEVAHRQSVANVAQEEPHSPVVTVSVQMNTNDSTGKNKVAPLKLTYVYPCPECPKTFSTRSTLEAHICSHTGEAASEYQCPKCDFACERYMGLVAHMKVHKTDKKMKTRIKDVDMEPPSDLYRCLKCNFSTKNLQIFRMHINTLHRNPGKVRNEMKNQRGDAFVDSLRSGKPGRNHDGSEQDSVGKSSVKQFNNEPDGTGEAIEGKRPVTVFKELAIGEETNNSGTAAVELPRCYSSSSTESRKENRKVDVVPEEDDDVFRCNTCNFTTKLNIAIKVHMRKHAEEGRQDVQAKEITQTAASRKRSGTAKRVPFFGYSPLNARSFLCPLCQQTFIREKALDMHLRSHQEKSTTFTNTNGKGHEHTLNHPNQVTSVISRDDSSTSVVTFDNAPANADTQSTSCSSPLNFEHVNGCSQRVEKDFGNDSSSTRYKCRFCLKDCFRTQNLVIHERLHTGEKPFRCHLCSYAARQPSNLRCHLKTHLAGKQYKCDLCDFTASNRWTLCNHRSRQHKSFVQFTSTNEARMDSTEVRKRSVDHIIRSPSPYLRSPVKERSVSLARSVSVISINSSSLESINGSVEVEQEDVVMKEVMAKNDEGSTSSSELQNLGKFRRNVIQERDSGDDNGRDPDWRTSRRRKKSWTPKNKVPVFGSHGLGNGYTDDQDIDKKPFKCEYCPRRFRVRYLVQTHMRVHTGEKPFRCQVCPFATSHAQCLKIHQRTHTGEKPFKCPYCDYAATSSSNLCIHKKKHLRPFQCPHCPRFSIYKDVIERHELKYHGTRRI